jgi:hypothetical protein
MRKSTQWNLLLILIFGLTIPVSDAGAAGPWHGRVIDAETGQPLEGAVVLAFWTRSEASLGGWVATEYYASEEVVTGADGRFLIHFRWSYTVPLLVKVQGPEWRIFKAGYGQWRYRDAAEWERFERGGELTVDLAHLKTPEERLAFLRQPVVDILASIVPAERKPRLLEAVNSERMDLGLQRELR